MPDETDGPSGPQGEIQWHLHTLYADAGTAGKPNQAKRARTTHTGVVLRPQPQPQPQPQDHHEQQEEDDEKKKLSLEPGERVPICTTWRMPKEKEPMGPIDFKETSDMVRSIVLNTFQNLNALQHCYICQNGGDLLACDEESCHRVMCLKHVPKIQALPKDILDVLHFRCPSCHTIKTRAKAKLEEDKEMKKNPPIGLQPTGKKTARWTPSQAKWPSELEAQQATQKGKLPPKDRPANPYFVRTTDSCLMMANRTLGSISTGHGDPLLLEVDRGQCPHHSSSAQPG